MGVGLKKVIKMLQTIKKIITNEQGGVSPILVIVILAPLLVWLMLKPTYQHVLILRHAVIQKEVDYLLEQGARLGYVSTDMQNDSKQRLIDRGFESGKLEYSITSDTGSSATDPLNPLTRGIGLIVEISYPYDNTFLIDRLIGIDPPPATDRLKAKGIQMIERWD